LGSLEPGLQLLRRHRLDHLGDPPQVPGRVDHPGFAVAVELIGRLAARGCPGRQRRLIGRIDIVNASCALASTASVAAAWLPGTRVNRILSRSFTYAKLAVMTRFQASEQKRQLLELVAGVLWAECARGQCPTHADERSRDARGAHRAVMPLVVCGKGRTAPGTVMSAR
jgi:hypothetical protein